MPLRPTSRTQLGGHRFLRRRARLAVVGGDVRMLHDPLRRQSFALGAGLGVAALIAGVCGVVSLLSPAPDVSRSQIMTGAGGSGLSVRVGDTVHPVLNLASARLVLGRPDPVVVVREADLARTDRGALLGIPGAPWTLPAPMARERATTTGWTVCDEPATGPATGPGRTTVTVTGGATAGGAAIDTPGELGGDAVVLAAHDGTGWLLRAGTRTRVDLGDTRLLEVFGLQGRAARPVSAAVLDTLVEVAPLVRPVIPGAGSPVDYGLPGVRVGQVLAVPTATGETLYVALADGVQEVGPAVADLVRATVTVGDVARVPPDGIGSRRSTALDTSAYPARRPTVADPVATPVLCARWGTDVTRSEVHTALLAGTRPPGGRPAVTLARADGPGPRVDAVSVPGGGLLVTGVGGGPSASPRGGVLTVLTDTGVRSDVADAASAEALGLTGTPVAVPAGLLAALPSGPVLSRADALVQHDGMTPDPAPGERRVEARPGG